MRLSYLVMLDIEPLDGEPEDGQTVAVRLRQLDAATRSELVSHLASLKSVTNVTVRTHPTLRES